MKIKLGEGIYYEIENYRDMFSMIETYDWENLRSHSIYSEEGEWFFLPKIVFGIV